MIFFPVTDSTLSPAAIADFVKEKYALEGIVAARILKTGISHTYLITGSEAGYIFRVYSLHWRTEKEIAAEITLLQLLQENGIPVSYAIAGVQSQYIQQLQAPEGARYGVLFSLAKGEKMLSFPAAMHYTVGTIMANMHRVTHNLVLERVVYTPEVLCIDPYENLLQFLPADAEEMIFMKHLQRYLYTAFSNAAGNSSLRRGIVHMDIWFDNFVIDSNGQVTIFDFDFCGHGWLLLDIAYYILQLYSTEKDENEFMLKKDAFLKGYESITAISAAEKELLPAAGAALYYFYLGIQCRRYDNWSNVFLNEIYLKRFIKLLVKKWTDFNKLPVV